ncbi:type II toxin-antitoxin system HicA family toxin [Candidatus Pacearchaeota archaeon]|nr:type II toxin-antitoxin system HicA family toxin [Candidatus Pacearchaeota archaeon]
MPQLRKVSGEVLLKILCNKLGFRVLRQRGSHVSVVRESVEGKIGTVIPMHREIKIGTLKGILKQARISEEQISRFL